MRKIMPCSKCGDATLGDGKVYDMRRFPAIFSTMSAPLKYKCSCGTRNEVSQAQFKSLPNRELTVAAQEL